jgi:hypothetical protein
MFDPAVVHLLFDTPKAVSHQPSALSQPIKVRTN